MMRFTTSPFMWYTLYIILFAAIVAVMTGCRLKDTGGW